MGQGALLQPVNQKLHDMAIEYAARELVGGRDLNLSKLAKVWVGLKDGEVFGLTGYVLKPDIPVLRATDADVLRALAHRLNDYFADNGARGNEALVHIGDEKPEQRCPEWKQVMVEFGAKSANRFIFEVR
jgi:hypothetical protein